MGLKKILNSAPIILLPLLILQSCGTSKVTASQGGFYYSNIYFGKHFPPKYQQGIKDGCKTSKGYYTKSHSLFKDSGDYYNGWFLGRNRCKHLLKINENGDLIS